MLSYKKESYPIVSGQVAFEGIHKLIYKKSECFYNKFVNKSI